MDITEVRIRRISATQKMRAVASVTFDNAIVIHDIKIIDGPDGPFIAMPSRRLPSGEFRDVAHPIHALMRQRLEEAIFSAYEAASQEEMMR